MLDLDRRRTTRIDLLLSAAPTNMRAYCVSGRGSTFLERSPCVVAVETDMVNDEACLVVDRRPEKNAFYIIYNIIGLFYLMVGEETISGRKISILCVIVINSCLSRLCVCFSGNPTQSRQNLLVSRMRRSFSSLLFSNELNVPYHRHKIRLLRQTSRFDDERRAFAFTLDKFVSQLEADSW
jgi:hypothetical protein